MDIIYTGIWLFYTACVADIALNERIKDWRALRKALGLSQVEMARLLCLRRSRLAEMEQTTACRVHNSTIMLLRAWLQHPKLRERLQSANYPYPFPDDIAL
ncbi:MAG: hypothetical protein M0T85_16675 [Dehalococcoidales bacterium]|nr:hypothetical protein [Dehalococcoidales bacterium]